MTVATANAASDNAQSDVLHRTITVRADDGTRLAATVFEPAKPASSSAPVTIISSAAAVPRGYYTAFAKALAARGGPVLTYDYRGIGGSLDRPIRQVRARMRDWGQLDAPAILMHARKAYPGRPVHWIGHSYGGGFAVGLNPLNNLIDRHLGVAVPHGYWREMDKSSRVQVGLVMGVVLPTLTYAAGFMPGKATGLGEDLPKNAALEWRSWIMSRNSMWDTIPADELRFYGQARAPMCFIRVTDDPWASDRGVERIAEAFTGAAERRIIRLGPNDTGGQKVDHLGFFRSRFADTLWPKAFAWLEA